MHPDSWLLPFVMFHLETHCGLQRAAPPALAGPARRTRVRTGRGFPERNRSSSGSVTPARGSAFRARCSLAAEFQGKEQKVIERYYSLGNRDTS